ncbi:MAG TPA: GNAT family N-acetyltransferase [Chryseosolibacter sp.]
MLLSYRSAIDTDLEDVFQLYMDPLANAYLTYDLMPRDSFSSVYTTMLESGSLYVVLNDTEIIGTYRLIPKTHRQSHILYLGGFTVKTAMKGKGIGFEILMHIKQEAQKKNFKRIELTVDTDNRTAISLYRKVGFEIEGKLRNNYKLASTGRLYDEYVMALLLN